MSQLDLLFLQGQLGLFGLGDVLVGRHNVVVEDEKGLLDIIDPLHIVSIWPGSRRKTHRLPA